MNQFKESRDLGATWLESQIKDTGAIGDDVTDYYKVPAALQISGKTQSANKIIDWIRNHGQNENDQNGENGYSVNPQTVVYEISTKRKMKPRA